MTARNGAEGARTQRALPVSNTDFPLVRPVLLDLERFARQSGVHPELVRRFVALGLLEAARDSAGRLWFTSGQLSNLARIQRLRAGLPLNYAAIGLVIDLLDRIQILEAMVRTARRSSPPWT